MTPHTLTGLASALGIPYRGTFALTITDEVVVGLFADEFYVTTNGNHAEAVVKSPNEIVDYIKETYLKE